MTDDVLSVLFQQCVPSFQSIHPTCAHRSSYQIPGTPNRASRSFPNSQCRRSTRQNGSSSIRNTPTGRGGKRKPGWVHSEEGLGHVCLVHLAFHSPDPKSFHHSTPRIQWSPVYKGYIHSFNASVSWSNCLHRTLSSARIASLSSSRGASSFFSTRSNYSGSARSKRFSAFNDEPRVRTGKSVDNLYSDGLGAQSA